MRVEACLRMIRISRWKLNMVAKVIRGKSVEEALRTLAGVNKRAAHDVRKALLSAVANAEHNNGLDPDTLRVHEATVGRSLIMRRSCVHGRSRVGRMEKEFSQIRISLIGG